ncbi:uncharacterized protein LOC116843076 isoform X2 [Odontomachus brunneus]|uniref:uncharacterized protein LOC116843076 isoform X2 n=1 Tax=Odontomachus brunneus TaxID=486640 RepID=UPI0013F2B18C|nr:uncharacterized protein LOC116843076 isoform X2 [Odontomachus brunneus]
MDSLIDKMVIVKEEWIAIAILKLVENEKYVVEGEGATGLVAILAGQLDELKGKNGNIDTTVLGRCLERGLATEGRLLKFMVTVSDRPGGIVELCRTLAGIVVSIKDIMHETAWIMCDIFSVDFKVVCETRNQEHVEHLKNLLHQNYYKVVFSSDNTLSSNINRYFVSRRYFNTNDLNRTSRIIRVTFSHW